MIKAVNIRKVVADLRSSFRHGSYLESHMRYKAQFCVAWLAVFFLVEPELEPRIC